MASDTNNASYFLYWAKTRRSDETGAACHLLPYHNLDVAGRRLAVAGARAAIAAPSWAAKLGLPSATLRRLLVFCLGLHDIGKFARAFQGLARLEGVELVAPLSRLAYTKRHDTLGAMLWHARWLAWSRDGLLGLPDLSGDRRLRRSLSPAFTMLMAPIFGHHGVPVDASNTEIERFFRARDDQSDDSAAAALFVADWARLIEPDWPLEKLCDESFQETLRTLSWTVAGWAVLSDWLGSNQDYFAYCVEPMPLERYWQEYALANAGRVLEASGFSNMLSPVAYDGLNAWFGGAGIQPTPLQRRAETQPLGEGPQLFILEDITGAGKTEGRLYSRAETCSPPGEARAFTSRCRRWRPRTRCTPVWAICTGVFSRPSRNRRSYWRTALGI